VAITVGATEEKRVPEKGDDEKRLAGIRLRKDTAKVLKERRRKGETYDDIIRRLLTRRKR
jgi:hypothetical protein